MSPSESEQLTQNERDLATAVIAQGMPPALYTDPALIRDDIARTALTAAEWLQREGRPVALETVLTRLVSTGDAERLGGRGKVTDTLIDPKATGLPLVVIEDLRREVIEAARLRNLTSILDRGTRTGKDPAEIAREVIEADGKTQPHHKPPFRDLLGRAAVTGSDFFGRTIPERPRLVGDWFREGDLGFIFAPRGVGKTWLAHLLVSSLTAGRDLGDWAVPAPVRVCLLDGEMPPGDVQERLTRLQADGERLTILSHQFLFDLAGRSFQLGDPEQRAALLDFCITEGINVLVIDNLSSVSNISENDNDEWPALGDWLLDFRRKGIAVVVVHHAGRNGQMRGASRREDPAFWIIRLDDSRERTATTDGARFRLTFTKQRNARAWPTPTDWHITTDESGHFAVETEPADNSELVRQCIRDGLDTCGDIAAELDLSKGTVSKIAHRLEGNGQLRIEGRRYILN